MPPYDSLQSFLEPIVGKYVNTRNAHAHTQAIETVLSVPLSSGAVTNTDKKMLSC